MFTFILTFNILLIVVTGGLGSLTGSVMAGIVITIMLEWLRIVENPIGFGECELQGIPGMRMVVFSLGSDRRSSSSAARAHGQPRVLVGRGVR